MLINNWLFSRTTSPKTCVTWGEHTPCLQKETSWSQPCFSQKRHCPKPTGSARRPALQTFSPKEDAHFQATLTAVASLCWRSLLWLMVNCPSEEKDGCRRKSQIPEAARSACAGEPDLALLLLWAKSHLSHSRTHKVSESQFTSCLST